MDQAARSKDWLTAESRLEAEWGCPLDDATRIDLGIEAAKPPSNIRHVYE
jgi:hypothetical protein